MRGAASPADPGRTNATLQPVFLNNSPSGPNGSLAGLVDDSAVGDIGEVPTGDSSAPQRGAIAFPSVLAPPARDDEFVVDPYALGRKGAALQILSNDGSMLDKPSKSSVVLLDEPVGGQAVVRKGVLAYTPNGLFEGDEVLHYTFATRGGSVSNVAEVRITVVRPPLSEALDDRFEVDAAQIGRKGWKFPILENDTAGSGELAQKSVVLLDMPEHGTTKVKNGFLVYRPGEAAADTHEFRYTVADATGRPSNEARVTIEVTRPASLALADLLTAPELASLPALAFATAATPAIETLVVTSEAP